MDIDRKKMIEEQTLLRFQRNAEANDISIEQQIAEWRQLCVARGFIQDSGRSRRVIELLVAGFKYAGMAYIMAFRDVCDKSQTSFDDEAVKTVREGIASMLASRSNVLRERIRIENERSMGDATPFLQILDRELEMARITLEREIEINAGIEKLGKLPGPPRLTNPTNLVDWAGGTEATLAIVLTDIIGSTNLRRDVGDDAMIQMLDRHFRKGRSLLQKHEGCEVKSEGDKLIQVFRTAQRALDFALDFSSRTGDHRIRIRAVIHTGPLTVREDDIDGTPMHYAARMEAIANAPEILVSDEAKRHIDMRGSHGNMNWDERRCTLREFGDQTLWSTRPPAVWVITFGTNVANLVESGQLPNDVPLSYPDLCDWLEADLRTKVKSFLLSFNETEPSARNGETLSVRCAIDGPFDEDGLLGALDWWEILEYVPWE